MQPTNLAKMLTWPNAWFASEYLVGLIRFVVIPIVVFRSTEKLVILSQSHVPRPRKRVKGK